MPPDSTPLIAGYEDARLLGRGGFGAVYRARDLALERDVAIKVHRQVTGVDSIREARVAAALAGHPNILPIHTAGTLEDGSAYVVMDFAHGGSLQERIGSLGPAEVVRIGVRLAGALHSLHEIGIVHRDVKPANILFTEFGEPMLADFGVASAVIGIGDDMPEGTVFGTPIFAPPETFLDEPVSAEADVYALALTLSVCLTGTNPLSRFASMSEMLRSIVTGEPARAIRTDERIPLALREVLVGALASDARDRPSAKEFGLQLQDAAVSLGFERPEMVLLEPSRRSARDRPTDSERDFSSILEYSTGVSERTVYRAALQVEDRLRRRALEVSSLGLAGAALATTLAEFVARPSDFESVARLLSIVGLVVISVALVGWGSVSMVVAIRRKRASSTSKQALEMSARLRRVYLKELRILRARQFDPSELTFSVERL